tara:strand:- start:75 stop:347 length:273 start_codon:yes stop_codon:yes gene_type:complete
MSEEKKNSEWKEREVGALWKKEGVNQNYYSGKIDLSKHKDSDSIRIVGFANKSKKDYPNAPDVVLYYSPPMESKASSVKDDSFEDESPML